MRTSLRGYRNGACTFALAGVLLACGAADDRVQNDATGGDTSDVEHDVERGDDTATSVDVAADTDVAADADVEGDIDAIDSTDADTSADGGETSDVSTTDLDAAESVARAVFAELGLDPDDATDVRTVWTDAPTYRAYLAAYADAVGVELPAVDDAAKAECAHLGAFNPTVPYCGPGCANSLTLSPPCLNQACYEHDRCYAAYECESGVTIDVSQSFGSLMTCCDAPLNTIWNACVGSVAADFTAGNIGASDVALFNAVSALMVLMNASSVFDPPTGLTPATCEEEFREGCTGFTLEARVTPEVIGAPSQTATVCATLDHGEGEPAAWTMRVTLDGAGLLALTEAAGAPGAEACVEYAAPENLPPSVEVVTFDVDALVDGNEVATDTVSLTLEGDAPSLDVVGDASRTVFAGSSTIELCFDASDDGAAAADVEVGATLAGDGLLSSATGSTDDTGRVCFDYTPPADVPDAVEVITASATIDGRTLTATCAITVEELGELVYGGTLGAAGVQGSFSVSAGATMTARVAIVGDTWTLVPEFESVSFTSQTGEVAPDCDNFFMNTIDGSGVPTAVTGDASTPRALTAAHTIMAEIPVVSIETYRDDGDPEMLCIIQEDRFESSTTLTIELRLAADLTSIEAIVLLGGLVPPEVVFGTLTR